MGTPSLVSLVRPTKAGEPVVTADGGDQGQAQPSGGAQAGDTGASGSWPNISWDTVHGHPGPAYGSPARLPDSANRRPYLVWGLAAACLGLAVLVLVLVILL